MFKYFSAGMESIVVLNCANMANAGVSLGLTMPRFHIWVRSSRYWKFLIASNDNPSSLAIFLGSDRYHIECFQVVARS